MKFRSLLFAGAVVAALAAPTAALAETDDTQITLSAGQLTFDTTFSADNFPNTTLNGLVQTVNAETNAWAVNDARGSLLPWNVKIKASQFSTGGATPKTLPAGSLSYVGVSASDVAAGAGQLAALKPTALGTPALAIDNAAGTEQIIVTGLGTGSPGLWNFAVNATGLAVVIPPTAEAGTYTSTITTTLASGLT